MTEYFELIIILKIIVFLMIHTFICYLLGRKLLSVFPLNQSVFAIPFGYISFLSIYQIGLIPAELFKLNSSYLIIWLVLLYGLIICFSAGCIKEKKHANCKIAVFIIAVMTICFLLYVNEFSQYGENITLADNIFYVTFVKNYSINGIALNTIDPLTGNYLNFSSIYAFYGQSYFLSAVTNLLNIKAIYTCNWIQPIMTIVLISTSAANVYILLRKQYKFVSLIMPLYLILSLFSKNFMISSVNLSSGFICISFIFVLLFKYIQTDNRNYLIHFVIWVEAAITVQSSYSFILAIFIFGYMIYKAFLKNFSLREISFMICPILFFLILYYLYQAVYTGGSYKIVLFLVLFAVFLLIADVMERKDIFCFSYHYPLILAILLFSLFAIGSCNVGTFIATWDGKSTLEIFKSMFCDYSTIRTAITSLQYSFYLEANIVLLLFYNKLNNATRFAAISCMTIFIVFFNPIVAPFLSKYLFDIVYGRIEYAWYNQLFLLVFAYQLYELCKEKIKKYISVSIKLFSFAFYLLLCISICVTAADKIQYTFQNVMSLQEDHGNYSYLTKCGIDSTNIGDFIDEYAENSGIDYYKLTMPRFVLNVSMISNHIKYSDLMYDLSDYRQTSVNYNNKITNEPLKSQTELMLQYPDRYCTDWFYVFEPKSVPDIKSIILESDTDLFIMHNWNSDEPHARLDIVLSEFSMALYSTENYTLYKVIR